MTALRLAPYIDAERDRIVATLLDWLRIPSHLGPPRARRRRAGLGRLVRRPAAPTPASSTSSCVETAGAPARLRRLAPRRAGRPDRARLRPPRRPAGRPARRVDARRRSSPPIVDGELPRPAAPSTTRARCSTRSRRSGAARRRRRAAGQPEVPDRGRGGGRQPPLRGPARRSTAQRLALRRGRGLRHRHVGRRRAVDRASGMRGLVAFDVVAAHRRRATCTPGLFGGAVPNPLHLAARLVDRPPRRRRPGHAARLLRRGPPVTDDEEAASPRSPFDEEFGRPRPAARRLEGEAGRSTLARIGYRPTAEVVGHHGGYSGRGHQDDRARRGQPQGHLPAGGRPASRPRSTAAFEALAGGAGARRASRSTVTPVGAVAPALTPVDHPAVRRPGRAIERVWGTAAAVHPGGRQRSGGGARPGPRRAVLFLGVGLPGDRSTPPTSAWSWTSSGRGSSPPASSGTSSPLRSVGAPVALLRSVSSRGR